MKKRIGIALLIMVLLLSACGGATTESQTEDAAIEETEAAAPVNQLEKYISNLPDNNARNAFPFFWNQMDGYCRRLESALRNAENTESYSFDPTNADEIPEGIAELYNYSEITLYDSYETHTDYKLEIEGAEVKLFFDGIQFYPSEYGYLEMQSIVDKYNGE